MNKSGICFCLFIIGCIALCLAPPTKADDQLFDLIRQRLDLMDAVAAYKWQQQRPIEDLRREQVVLEQILKTARQTGLDTGLSRHFFEIQIDAAKEIQAHWFHKWNKNKEVLLASPDLDGEIRPKLSTLGNQILKRMGEIGYLAPDPALKNRFYSLTQTEGLTLQTQAKLYAALLASFTPKPGELLYQIKQSGKLKVATTGDYAPFSYRDNDQFKGIDIDMANDLAANLKAEVVWVQTSWPNLLKDLKEKKFHIAMSGISFNKEREKFGDFSMAYHKGGKTPISRCEDVGKYDGLEKINQKKVRVIVNPGGTNYQFASSQLDKASLRVFEDNRLIFKEIENDRADVMITDAIEVRMQSNHSKKLCPTMPGRTLTSLTKAYLMPKDPAFQAYVNNWLNKSIEDGNLKGIFNRHL